jgi:hypothetical protein
MKALLKRELRRQGFYALGPLAVLLVGPLLMRALSNPSGSLPRPAGPLSMLSPDLWFLLLAGVLGVAAVAPDRGSGGQAFLRRVPLSLKRAFALRVVAGGLWLGMGLVLASGGLLLTLGSSALAGGGSSISAAVFLWPLAYAAGLVASSITQRPLAAIGLAIPLGLLTVLTFFGPLLATGLRPNGGGLFLIPSGVALGAAFLAYRHGRIHLEGLRPFGIALGALLSLSLVSAGGTALARSAHKSVVLESLQPLVASGRSEIALVTLTGGYWYGWEQRVVALRPGRPPLAIAREGTRSPQLSPDGRQVLVRGDTITSSGALCDLETGEVRDLDLGFSDSRDVLWRKEGPALVSLATSLSLRIEGATPPDQPRRVLVVSCDDVRTLSSDDAGRVYLLGAQSGLQRWSGLAQLELPQAQPGQKLFPTPREELAVEVAELPFPADMLHKVRGLRISPGGELGLVLLGRGQIALLEVATGRLEALPAPPASQAPKHARSERPTGLSLEEGRISAGDLRAFVDPRQVLGTYRLSFGPQGRGVVVEGASGWAVWRDLRRGFTRTVLQSQPGQGLPSWASDEHAILLSSGRVWQADAAAPEPLRTPAGRPLSWLGSQQLLTQGLTPEGDAAELRSLTLYDLTTGRQTRLGGAQ